MAMMWHVHHIWPAGSRYSFNTYHHWKLLAVHSGVNIRNKEGVMQGDPLAMILYALGVLPIIDCLGQYCQDKDSYAYLLFLLQIWYVDDSAFAGKFPDMKMA
eukprot:9016738-Ditylum_brightwellii.AAC.1